MLVIPVMEKMNRTLLAIDLELSDTSKLVTRVRCVPRNMQGRGGGSRRESKNRSPGESRHIRT